MKILDTRSDSFPKRLALSSHVSAAGTYGIYAALVIIYFWFGGMKFTNYEAQGLVPLVSNSPLLGWLYLFFSVETFSNLLGVLEISVGVLIAGRLVSPTLSLIGGALSAGLFFTTLSFLVSTPGVIEPSLGFPGISVMPGQFLLKDIGLLAASVFVAGHSLAALERG
ncbi:DUF417 family protein [Pseudomonas sp. GD03944]|uniref:YkgB family protein n=1 Tax=Pseudomonas sp. GD03944 TaxID=2975409 RepID=UPI00244ACE00|nr:DUF417 family protein [Pseudomonas sp. GD03944]MDH1265229.1 YkgB family protein [Pseudomonas sp. GD03944]